VDALRHANPNTGKEHFGGAQYALSKLGLGDTELTVYTGLIALAANLLVVLVGSLALRALGVARGEDVTREEDYDLEAGDHGCGRSRRRRRRRSRWLIPRPTPPPARVSWRRPRNPPSSR
jgi:hypothetical protein